MVFCYKIITESPRRSRCASPKKISPRSFSNVQSSVSDLIGTLDYETYRSDIWTSIPEKDIKLLQALARKREESAEREKLAEHFQKMWLKEKEEREIVEAETTEQYKRYLHQKRCQERRWQEFRSSEKAAEQQARRGKLLDCISRKEQKSALLKAQKNDKQIMKMIDRSMEEEARLQLAVERRARIETAETLRRRAELYYAQKKEDDARQRRHNILRDTAKRVTITNALTSWETALQRHGLATEEVARRTIYAAQHARKRARGVRVTRAMDKRRARARQIAAATELMRDAVKNS
ncbi:unnamed protein product [Leptosia nina]|uniref:Trichohyalin-plectin-homology domain-containing protein n=1 Tax=Leptosia nina TaxID=320188 RepID=A0AAV1IXF2_9NEOP